MPNRQQRREQVHAKPRTTLSLCAGGCGQRVATAKCSACAARAVGDWLRSKGDPESLRIAAKYYPQ